MNTKRLSVDPATYAPLISLIGKVESNNNYNAYFGNTNNKRVVFTNMTIKEVLKWQTNFVADGNPSSAVGRYQILSTTLESLVRERGFDMNQKFDTQTQDQIAIALFERRGSIAYVNNELTKQEFAANLAKEWAALPKIIGDKPKNSYYAGDGLNKSRTSVKDILSAVEVISAK